MSVALHTFSSQPIAALNLEQFLDVVLADSIGSATPIFQSSGKVIRAWIGISCAGLSLGYRSNVYQWIIARFGVDGTLV